MVQEKKVYDEITEIEEIWRRVETDEEEPIRLNRKYVWETAKRVCDYINAHEDLIHITPFGEYRMVMKKVMTVIKKAPMWSEKEGKRRGKRRATNRRPESSERRR